MVQSISGLPAVQPSAPIGHEKEVRRPETEARQPVMDEYVPEEKREPSGRYWLERDEEGTPRVVFDAPEEQSGTPEGAQGADGQDKCCTVNTDKVDREIRQLKQQKQALEQQLQSETDEARRKTLEAELMQVERELMQKDTDAYRRRHAAYTYT